MTIFPRGVVAAGFYLLLGFLLADGFLFEFVVTRASPTADKPAPQPTAGIAGVPNSRIVALNGHNFTLPDGFTIELAAGPPLVDRPVSAAFDDKGRLYVTDSSGSNEKTTEQVKTKPHRIVRLESTKGDGKFDKSTVYVKNISFPEGAMWLNGSLYVAAPPHIRKFTDSNDDGVADKAEIWFDGKTLGHCANDLHGPFLGPDGWIYWTKGAFAKQEYTLPNGKKWTTRASHLFRAKPDGTNIEPVMTGGMDNPVGVAFTPTGEPIVACTFLQHPADGKRDGLIHAVYGGLFGKDHDPIYEHPWTSPHLMPIMTHLGPAAPAAVRRYESDQFGKEYTDNLFCAQFNLRKVSRHVLVPDGSTYRTIDSDFVVSDNRDFHPTDIVEDADGSLLILDTGGWYKLCCPTSQLAKADVTGAIYRVRKVGAHKVEDPWGLKIDWKDHDLIQIAKYLGDPRPWVSKRAIDFYKVNNARNVTQLLLNNDVSLRAKENAIWACSGLSTREFNEVINVAEGVYETSLLLLAARVASLIPGSTGYFANDCLRTRWPHLRRLVAETLGRYGESYNIGEVFYALAQEDNDRFFDHALIFALIDIGLRDKAPEDVRKELTRGLKHRSPRVRRAALTALDQIPNGKLEAKSVLAVLDSSDAALKETAWWIAGRHPEWGHQLADRFAKQLKAADTLAPAACEELAERLMKFAKNDAVQKALADALNAPSKMGKGLALRAMSRSVLKAMPEIWRTALIGGAPQLDNRDLLKAALAVFRAMPVAEAEFDQFVAALPSSVRQSDDLRLAVLSAGPPGSAVDDATAVFLISHVGRTEVGAIRAEAADSLARIKLTPMQLALLELALRTVGPLELGKLFAAFAKAKDEKTGLAFIAGLSDPLVRPLVRAEQVKPILDKYPKPVRDEAEKLYALLAESRKDERAKLDKLMAELKPGDVRRGQAVFNGAKAACFACHKIGYVGGTVGPDLRGIGRIRTDRDLMEAIVFPSASFVRSYEPYRVTTADGRAFNGVLKKDAPDEIVLAVAADQEVRIPRADVEQIVPGTVSVMPAGLDQQLSPQDLADLIAFLKANK